MNKLTNSQIGGYVFYVGRNYKKEVGRIKSYDNERQVAWVVYNCGGDWDNYQNYTGANTRYEDLDIFKKEENIEELAGNYRVLIDRRSVGEHYPYPQQLNGWDMGEVIYDEEYPNINKNQGGDES